MIPVHQMLDVCVRVYIYIYIFLYTVYVYIYTLHSDSLSDKKTKKHTYLGW